VKTGAERSVNNISYKTKAVLKPQLKPPWKVFKPLLISTRQTRKYMYLFVLLEFVVFHNQCRKIFSIPVLHNVFCYLKFWFLLWNSIYNLHYKNQLNNFTGVQMAVQLNKKSVNQSIVFIVKRWSKLESLHDVTKVLL
jgi:hypothetical protein